MRFFLQEHTVSKLDQGHDDTVSTVFTDIFWQVPHSRNFFKDVKNRLKSGIQL